MKNREIFDKDPLTANIPNLGVAKVVEPRTDEEWEVLRYELSSFVSDGEYGLGLERILSSFLTNLDREEQPAVWVSGFYGSGKSHLVRVLEHLWRNPQFSDGATARSLTRLTPEVQEHLRELETRGKQEGGLWSAAGTLGAGAGNSVRLAMLGIIFRGAGLPSQYPQARLAIYLRSQGSFERLTERIQAEGQDFDFHLSNMYVSPLFARALAESVPGLPDDVREIRELLKTQYPPREDISDDEMLETIQQVLMLQSSTPGRLPYTLLIFDEQQQFIGEDAQRTLQVMNVVEACSARFKSRMLFVATGQSALQSTPQLSKLQGRFLVRVQLSDRDVQTVVREVVLRKKPDMVPLLKSTLERASGEIDRQFSGTRIGASSSDKPDLVPDYPLLPVRRRFWEGVVRVVDSAGGAGGVRTQLRIVHDATRAVGDRDLGTVIPGDAIYDQLKFDMLQVGLLLPEMQQRIESQVDTPDGKLKSRVCATVFLMSKLADSGPAATGVNSTPGMIADMLVDDLVVGSAELRQRIPLLLTELVEDHVLIQVEDQYRLQTRESAEWQADYQSRLGRIRNDAGIIADKLTKRLRAAATSALKGTTLAQGNSKTPREFRLEWGQTMPATTGNRVPVWVRDEWSVTESTVRSEAQHAGEESPVVFVFLPRYEHDTLRNALASLAAAEETVSLRPVPRTPEGVEAQAGIKAFGTLAESTITRLIGEVVNRARVYAGGGVQLSDGPLSENVKTTVENALARLFPRFSMADHAGWGRVVATAGGNASTALEAVGWHNDPDTHQVCREILAFVGGAGKRGAEVRAHFAASPYGWPQDAVDGALLVLLGMGKLNASRNGQSVLARQLPQSQIGTVGFVAEDVYISAKQRIELREFLSPLHIQCASNQESDGVRQGLQLLISAAELAGGDPPAPLRPSLVDLRDLQSMSGNRQLLAVHDRRENLLAEFEHWRATAAEIAQRLPRWQLLQSLLAQAGGLDAAHEIGEQASAIREQRALLADPDPVQPLLSRLTDALRAALVEARAHMVGAREEALRSLEGLDAWQQLSSEQQQNILTTHNLGPVPELRIGSDHELLSSVQDIPLQNWDDRMQAIAARAAAAREVAIREAEPERQTVLVSIPHGSIDSIEALDDYLSRIRVEILSHLEAGKLVIT